MAVIIFNNYSKTAKSVYNSTIDHNLEYRMLMEYNGMAFSTGLQKCYMFPIESTLLFCSFRKGRM